MSFLAAAMLWAGGAVDVWAADALDPIAPETIAPSPEVHAHRVYLARGEYEAFQIAIRADEALESISIDAPPLGRGLPPPDVFRVGYVAGATGVRADPLYPIVHPEPVAPNVTALFWVRYHVPADARVRVYDAEITVQYGKRRRQKIRLTAEVFDTTLPQVPSLRTLFPLPLEPIAQRYGWALDDAAAWASFYQGLAPYAIATAPKWDSDRATVGQIWQQHVAAQHAAFPLSAIDLTPLVDIDSPDLSAETLAWLAQNAAAQRAVVQFDARDSRAQWPGLKRDVAALRGRYPELDVLLAAPLHPALTELPDIWALPISKLHPAAIALLQDNRTLAAPLNPPPASVAASSETTAAPAAEGYDGSFFTGWRPANTDAAAGAWWQVDFTRPVEVASFRLAFAPNATPPAPQVSTTHDAQQFVPATVTWKTRAAARSTDFYWLEGKLTIAKTTVALRFVFPAASSGDWELVELQFNGAPFYPTRSAITPPEIWLDTSRSTAMFDAGAHKVHRLLAALCWHYGLEGILGPPLADWPPTWPRGAATQPLPAPPPAHSALWYPGPDGPVPSIRLELLREGIEDYSLLTRLREAAEAGEVDANEVGALLGGTWINPALNLEALDKLAEEWRERRILAGRLLTGW